MSVMSWHAPITLTVVWTSSGSATEFQVYYKLTNEDHCKNEVGNRVTFSAATSNTQIYITGRKPYSEYKVYVTPVNSVCGVMKSETGSTGETGKKYLRVYVR